MPHIPWHDSTVAPTMTRSRRKVLLVWSVVLVLGVLLVVHVLRVPPRVWRTSMVLTHPVIVDLFVVSVSGKTKVLFETYPIVRAYVCRYTFNVSFFVCVCVWVYLTFKFTSKFTSTHAAHVNCYSRYLFLAGYPKWLLMITQHESTKSNHIPPDRFPIQSKMKRVVVLVRVSLFILRHTL